MINRGIVTALSVHSLFVLIIILASLTGLLEILIASLLLLIWGALFFAGFFSFGQKVRPRPYADLVTGLRLVAGMIFYLLIRAQNMTASAALFMVLIIELADGIDGWLARKTGPTDFGGVWDMESDAFIILLFSVSVYWYAGLPAWSLIPGVIRYVFFFPFLILKPERAEFPLSLSWYSKTICVAAVFCLASAWYLPEAAATAIILVSILITVSFMWETVFYIYLRLQTRKR